MLQTDHTIDAGLLKEAISILTPRDFFPALDAYKGDDFLQQDAFVNDRHQYSLATAASRTGKTYGAGNQFVERIAEDMFTLPWDEETVYWCVAPTHLQNAAQAKELKRLIPDWMIDWDKMYRNNQSHMLQWGARFGDGSLGGTLYLIGNIKIELRSAHNPESLVAEKVRGIWITEIAKIKYLSWSNIVERLSNYDDSWLIGDTTPMGHNWYYRDVWAKVLDGSFVGANLHTWTAYDSPYVSREKIAAAKANLPSEFFARGFLASFAAFFGKIYTAWDEKKHCVTRCPFTPSGVIVSADLNANTEKPAAFGVYMHGGNYTDPSHIRWPRMHLQREYYEAIGLDYERYADALALQIVALGGQGYSEERGNLEFIIDPSAHRAFKKMLRDRGLNPKNANNEVVKGIRTFGGAMVPKHDGKPIFTVSTKCKNFVSEVNGYSWKVNSAGIALEEPNKTLDDHMLDSGRYAAMQLWNKIGGGGRVNRRAA